MMNAPVAGRGLAVERRGAPPPTTSRPAVLRPAALPYVCSSVLAAMSTAAAVLSVSFPAVLGGVAAANGNLRGTAVIMLVVGIPVLVIAMIMTARGSARGHVVWLGAVGYLIYQAVMFCFATPLNNFFLIYIAQLGLAFWSVVLLLRATDLQGFTARISPRMPAKTLAGCAATVVILNAAAWLAPIVPAVLGPAPTTLLAGSGLLTNPVYVQDLAIWLPLFAAAAFAGWSRRTWGLLTIGAMLVMTVLESIGIATDQWFGADADPSSTISSVTMTPVFAVVALIVSIPLMVYLRNIDRRAPSGTGK